MTSGGVKGVCGAPGEGEALRSARGNRLPGQYPRRPADGGGWVGPCTDALRSAGHKAGEYGGVPPPGEPTPGNCREDGPAAPPDDHRMAQRLQIGSRQGERAGSYCRRAEAYHTTTVDRLHKGDHPTGYWCGHPESGPRRRPPCGRPEIPGHPTGSGVWIWSDGSAEGGVTARGGGALITLPSGEEREVRMPAGAVCSSTRAELVAICAP